MDVFWDQGFSGTSLDDLSERMEMKRPSMYAAFGDKQALYLKTLERYIESRKGIMQAVLDRRPLREALRELYRLMIDRFLEGDRGARGCYLMGTAVTEAVGNGPVRRFLVASQREMDAILASAFAAARKRGETPREADPAALAVLASSVAHALAVRARAGQPRAQLRRIADSAVDLLVPAQATRRSPSE